MQTTMLAPTPKNGSVPKNSEPILNIYKTYDYGMFKIMHDNRSVNTLHVQRLVESFKAKHLVSPIIVNERKEVIDGQHRLLASQETNLPVYYIVLKGYGIEEVQIFNTNQKNWGKVDYLKMYCTEGRKPYIELQKFMEDFPEFGIQSAERLVTLSPYAKRSGKINGHKAQMKDFEEGKLVVPNITKSYQLARKVMEFSPYYPGFHRGVFISAILPLFASKVYDHKEMIHKMGVGAEKGLRLVDCPTVEAYRMLLEEIYNWKRQKENKVSFRYQ